MTVQRPRILAIDDTPLNLLTLGAALTAEFELQIATSGPEGLALAAESPPDLILLDVMMPGMDGFETCRRLKANPALRDIPVIFVTALTELDAEARGLSCGAADYILKPINIGIAQQRIRNLLEREGLRREVASHRDQLAARVADLEQSERRLSQSEEQARYLLRQQQVLLDELRRHNDRMLILNRLTELLLSCETRAEAYAIIMRGAGPLFVGCSGGLAILDEADPAYLRVVATWGDPKVLPVTFPRDGCLAMRRGDCCAVTADAGSPRCRHVTLPPPAASICAPLTVRGDTFGLLYLGTDAMRLEGLRPVILAVSEAVKLVLSNLKLQETLREQTIRDPLTGLYNRRYLDETLPRELHRCQRGGESLAAAMLDVDHFKRFNDAYGHEAGDAVLRAIGAFLKGALRASDLACRYGGEELTIVLPGASLEDAEVRLDYLRTAIRQLRVQYQDGDLPAITVSIGVATLGEQQLDAAALLARADAALYRAKAEGRNRVVVASG